MGEEEVGGGRVWVLGRGWGGRESGEGLELREGEEGEEVQRVGRVERGNEGNVGGRG